MLLAQERISACAVNFHRLAGHGPHHSAQGSTLPRWRNPSRRYSPRPRPEWQHTNSAAKTPLPHKSEHQAACESELAKVGRVLILNKCFDTTSPPLRSWRQCCIDVKPRSAQVHSARRVCERKAKSMQLCPRIRARVRCTRSAKQDCTIDEHQCSSRERPAGSNNASRI